MAADLSQNWKKLQVTLARTKRKLPLTNEQQRKSMRKQTRRQPKMGIRSSYLAKTQEARPSTSLTIWAEDNEISPKDLEKAYGEDSKDAAVLISTVGSVNGGLSVDVKVGEYVAMDCEMVGVGGEENRSVLARVSIVNIDGEQVYDSFVMPQEFVTDWRTHISGVCSKNMAAARSFEEVQNEVSKLLLDRVLVGHAVKNDLEAMMLGHPRRDIRDTSRYPGFRKYSGGKTPSLKKLAKEILGINIQSGEHSSVEDARATMLLFRRYKQAIESDHAKTNQRHIDRKHRPPNKTRTKAEL